MGTEEKPRKIKDVIDKINNEWGEEHEKELKKIFNSNICITPLIFFCFSFGCLPSPITIFFSLVIF